MGGSPPPSPIVIGRPFPQAKPLPSPPGGGGGGGSCRGAKTGQFGNFGVFPVFCSVFWPVNDVNLIKTPLKMLAGTGDHLATFSFSGCPKL